MNIAKEIQSFLSKKQKVSITEIGGFDPSAFKTLNYTEAKKCFVLEEDIQKLQNSIPFGREPLSVRVSKKNTLYSKMKLSFRVRGPSDAIVDTYEESNGIERCEISPSKPGKYHLEILWNERHIQGSPFSFVFNLSKVTCIHGNGLDLQNVQYRLGIEHRFKLDCSDLEEGNLVLSISPPTAAKIEVATPPGQPQSYLCKIVPREAGKHKIALMYSGKHIYGSPFIVKFGYPGDASKCILSSITPHHRPGSKVSLQVDTTNAGYGQLRAGVKDALDHRPVDLIVSRIHENTYTLEFDPGSSSECMLAVKYDHVHIAGSPFRLVFNEVTNSIAEGPGLSSALTGAWNVFSVIANKTCKHHGALKVNIHNSRGERIETVVSARSPLHFDVSYYPKEPGLYTISLQWGGTKVLGSPFQVPCTSPSLAIADRPLGDVTLGETISFKVRPLGIPQDKGALRITARNSSGKETVGQALWDSNKEYYSCTLEPDKTGKYPISVKHRDAHILGSPFVVTVINPPSSQLVRAWGSGLKGTTLDKDGKFTVDTNRAGTGLLSVSVQGYQDSFDIRTIKDPSKGLIQVSYSSRYTGLFRMDVKWSGESIPGSPFNITVTKKAAEENGGWLRTISKHEMFLGNVTNVGVNGDWLKVWRSSGRFKQRHLKANRLEIEEAITYF